MPKGGARAHSGPAPDPNSITQSNGEWTVLPATGRAGKPPAWPLSKASPREATLWRAEWRRPQAVMWERQGQEVEVALYVRSLVGAEKADAPVALRTLVRQQMEALGVSVPGMLRNRWRIADVDLEHDDDDVDGEVDDVRSRLTVVAGGGA